jgi:hypothetical protein
VLPDTFTLDETMTSIKGVDINIIDPDEPGSIEGKILDLTGLGIFPTARFDPLADGGKTVMAYADSTGAFTVKSIPPGGYVLTAFIDAVPDSVPGSMPDPSDSTGTLQEPFSVYPDTISVPPGGKLELEPIYIRGEKKKDE